ncbi:SusC/RagA family TonB-linked outer membrane protein [Alkalitalea saponilacus]|nr:TonB-dependent receptor [Alkalitalea saponilacus]
MLFVMSLWSFGLALMAQGSILVQGKVEDSQGFPLPGVNIIVKGSTIGTVSDINGNYQLQVPDAVNAVLVFRFIGFDEREIAVNNQSQINVVLTESFFGLDEVVAIGYGTVQRRDITGSVASVSGDALQAIPVSNVTEAITGKLAGVQIAATEGSPDAEIRIRVRGGGSITGDNSPLFIVDGFPVETISDISPSDIESIDVLKDASSTAIYGSRGANGVIIVTTKRGREGRMTVNYNAYTAWKRIANTLDVLSPYDFTKWQYERALLANDMRRYNNIYGNFQDLDLYQEVQPNDYQNQIFGRTGFTFNHNVSLTGGTEKTTYALSYAHMYDRAIMQMSNFNRDNLSFNMTNRPNDRITIDLSFRYANTEINGGGANEQNEVSSADSRLKFAMIYPPFPVSGLTDAEETDPDFLLTHPMESLRDNDRYQNRVAYNLNASVAWEIIDNLTIKSDVGLDDFRSVDDRFYGPSTYYVKNVPSGENQNKPAIVFNKQSRETFRNTNTINYNFRNILPSDHRVNVLAGQEYIIREQESHNTVVHGFPSTFGFSEASKLSAQGSANSITNHLSPDDILLSFFGRANYDYMGRYLLSATFRADGSSKFGDGNKWGYFPSAAFAWRISDEIFFENTRDWLDDLKIRFSYGTAGNNNIPSGQIVQSMAVSTTTWVNNYDSYWAPSRTLANPDLKWETTITRNLGLDYTMLRGRINGSFEAYINTTQDLLMRFPIPGTGYIDQYRNMGETENRGFEASINWVAIDRPNYGFSVSGNIGFNKNEIKSLGLMENFEQSSGWASTEIPADYVIQIGGSVGKMYGYISDGRYEVSDFEGYFNGEWVLREGVPNASSVVGTIRPGTKKLRNLNPDEDNVVNLDDRTIIGDANPLHTGGIALNARAYGFDLSAAFNWSYGNDVYNANKVEYTSTSKYHSRNMITMMEDGKRWTNLLPDGTISNDPAELAAMNANTTMWSPYMPRFVFSDWAVEDGSFLRLNTLTLGYTLPRDIVNRVNIQNLRFYVSGYNLYTWTNYTGFDPEVSTRRRTPLTPGVDYSAYPRSRSIVFGMNLSF